MKIAERIFRRKDYYITSPFGYRKSVDKTVYQDGFHDGVDYGTNQEKWNQYALENGKVLSCGLDAKFNNAKYVWVEYPRLNFKLLYYHLDSIKVTKGQIVNENTIIGTTGKTGDATGIHLHLGMKYLNSTDYVNAEEYDYIPLNSITPTERDNTKHQVQITCDILNARDSANGNKLGVYVPMGIYDVLNELVVADLKWIEINKGVWCALVEDCYIEYQNETIDYKKLYEEAQAKLDKIRGIL